MAKIISPTAALVSEAAEALRRGEIVGMPTETVYGLAASAYDERALASVFAVKERPTFDPLIVHLSTDMHYTEIVDAAALTPESRALIERLIAKFWPGPLTLVLPKLPCIPDLATSGLSSVAVRMPRHPVAQALIEAAGVPLAAPSANRFGRISPTTAEAVNAELGDRINLILDGGPCEVGLESTVLGLGAAGELLLLRPGGTPSEAIEKVTGKKLLRVDTALASGPGAKAAPGMLASHYAPTKPLRILPRVVRELHGSDAVGLHLSGEILGLLLLSGDPEAGERLFSKLTGCRVIARSLSADGDLNEAARRLFAELRALDASEAALLFAEPLSDERGLGHAIADRLRRASVR